MNYRSHDVVTIGIMQQIRPSLYDTDSFRIRSSSIIMKKSRLSKLLLRSAQVMTNRMRCPTVSNITIIVSRHVALPVCCGWHSYFLFRYGNKNRYYNLEPTYLFQIRGRIIHIRTQN